MEAAILQAVDNTKRYETEICALQDKVIPEYISIRSVTFFFRSFIHLFCLSWTPCFYRFSGYDKPVCHQFADDDDGY